jgi:hypothetical protein
VKSTFIKAIELGNFTTWPNITAHHVKQYLEKSEATIKGHINQQRKNVRCTNPKERVKTSATEENEPEVEPRIMECTNLIHAKIYDTEGHIYTDLTGRFPSISSGGYKYILVLYDFGTNNILADPMKNRSDSEVIRAYTVIYDELTSKGLKPMFQTMDNEASKALKTFLTARNIKFQLVAPHVH